MAEFEKAIDKVLAHEGGYVNDPADPGGETNFGISKRRYPNEDISALTPERARQLYRIDYWQYDAIESQAVATKVFDLAVNMGPLRAHKILQMALNRLGPGMIEVDGVLGPQTLWAVNRTAECELLAAIRQRQKEFYLRLVHRDPGVAKFLPGWLKRADA